MFCRPGRLWWVSVVAILAAAGCGGNAPAPLAPETAAVPEQRTVVKPTPPAPDPVQAEEAVRAVLAGLRDDRPEVAWQALPDSYQQDANRLLHEFAAGMDAAVWNRTFAVLRKAVDVLRERKALVLGHPLVAQAAGPAIDRVRTDYDLTVNLLGTLAHSDLADLERLRAADVGGLLRTTGGALMQQASAISRLTPGDPFHRGFKRVLDELQITAVEQSGDTAMLTITLPEAEAEQQVPFVRVEGKWLPKSLARGWKPALAEARDNLRNTAEMARANRERLLEQLDRVDAVLDRLQAADTQARFNRVVAAEIVGPLRSMLKGTLSDAAPERRGSTPPLEPGQSRVTVVFDRELDAATEEALQLNFSALTDDGQGLAIPRIDRGTTRYEIAPVRDVAAFARRIDFAEVTDVDPAARTITVRRREPPGGAEP